MAKKINSSEIINKIESLNKNVCLKEEYIE